MKRKDKYSPDELRELFLKKYKDYSFYGKILMLKYYDDFCNEEIPTVQRIATINTIEEYEKLLDERGKLCVETECSNCKFYGSKCCTTAFLGEGIEVEE